ncbi:hypothetical protein HYV44_00730 [Candidatus Microgenomates bacterium]|nr:hypothetical protein [Candidatus Microgenomates bacterium]
MPIQHAQDARAMANAINVAEQRLYATAEIHISSAMTIFATDVMVPVSALVADRPIPFSDFMTTRNIFILIEHRSKRDPQGSLNFLARLAI